MNKEILRSNLAVLRCYTSAKICAVVKADLYGHGLPALDAFADADEFAVSSIGEAIQIRERTDKPVNILSLPDKTITCEYRQGIIPSVSCEDDMRFVVLHGADSVNIKINSGMNRYGAAPQVLDGMLRVADGLHLRVKSVFSHIYDLSAAEKQFERFMACVKPLDCYIPQKHILSGSFVLLPSYMHLDMVRPGIVLYGYGHESVRPAATAKCSITQIRTVYADENIGYGHCVSGERRVIAVLGAGYADGCRRITDNTPRYVAIAGCLCPVAGQICMDAMMADITGVAANVGDEAEILGPLYGGEALATSCHTIAYEILTGFSRRVPREYI